MDKVKELKELEAKLKKIKVDVYDAENDLGASRKDKIALIKEISTLTGNKEALTKEVAGLREKIKGADNQIAQDKLVNSKEATRLKRLDDELKVGGENNTNQAFSNKRIKEQLDKDRDALKSKEAAFAYKEKDYKVRLDELDKNILAFEVEKKAFNYKQQEEKLKLEKDKEDTLQNLEKSKQLKSDYENRLKVLDEAIKKSEEEEKEYRRLQSVIDSRNLLIDDQAKVNDRQAEILARNLRGVEREKLAMQTEKDQMEIKRLRVEKLIKEKGIKKELEDLQKELDAK